VARRDGKEKEREERGIVYGLVVMGQGGWNSASRDALPGTGRLRLTSSLGDVYASPFRF